MIKDQNNGFRFRTIEIEFETRLLDKGDTSEIDEALQWIIKRNMTERAKRDAFKFAYDTWRHFVNGTHDTIQSVVREEK
jgi:hypothetical protein